MNRRVVQPAMASLGSRTAAPGIGFETIDWFHADDESLDYSRTTFDGMSFDGIAGIAELRYAPTPGATP